MSRKQLSFDGFEPANTTPVPDVLFDELLPYLSEAELKVLLYIIRRTSGFKKTNDAISLSQFQNGITKRTGEILDQGCGVKNRTTITNALASLEKKGCIQSEKADDPQGDKATTVYKVRFQSEGVVRNSYHGSTANVPPVVSETYHGSTQEVPGVVRKTYLQETVIQETVKQLDSIQESTIVATSAEDRTHAENVTHLEKWKEESGKQKAVKIGESNATDRNILHSGRDSNGYYVDSVAYPGNISNQVLQQVTSSHSQLDIGNDDFADRPTEKRPAIKTPGAGVPLSLAANPPVGDQDDAASGQAISVLGTTPAQRAGLATGHSPSTSTGAVQASASVHKTSTDDQVNGANKAIPTRLPMALTAKQIQKQLEARQEQIFTIYEAKIGRKPSHSKANKDGALLLAQDDVSDEDIKTTIDEILKDNFLAKNLSLSFVHSKLDALARKPIPLPVQNGKNLSNGIDHERNKRYSEELQKRFEENGPTLKGLKLRHA